MDEKTAKKVRDVLHQHITVVESLINENIEEITRFCEVTLESLEKGGKIMFMGNGGSAADSQHLAAEFIGRFVLPRNALPAIALTTDSSIITSIGNDFGFDQIFERQIAALGYAQDIVVGISSSGNSRNVIKGIEEAKRKSILTVGLSGGQGGQLSSLVDIPIIVSSKVTARIQEAHILIGHIICEYCDEYFAIHS